MNRTSYSNVTLVGLAFQLNILFNKHISLGYEGKKTSRPFKCGICPASFGGKATLNDHTSGYHGGKKMYKCSVCDYSCVYQGQLKIHIRTIHESIKPHVCPICSSSFIYMKKMRNQIKSVHENIRTNRCTISS